MSAPLIPNDELVARGGLLAVLPDLVGKVATKLPDADNWSGGEFVQIMAVGGSADLDVPQMAPVVTVNCFATSGGSSLQPPWGKANHRAMQIWQQTMVKRWPQVVVDPGGDYGRAQVQTVAALQVPRRLPSDASQYAVYSMDLLISWLPIDLVVADDV